MGAMSIKKVFVIIGVLVLAFLLFQQFFMDGGILQIGYNAAVGQVNGLWETLTGETTLIPEWGVTESGTDGTVIFD